MVQPLNLRRLELPGENPYNAPATWQKRMPPQIECETAALREFYRVHAGQLLADAEGAVQSLLAGPENWARRPGWLGDLTGEWYVSCLRLREETGAPDPGRIGPQNRISGTLTLRFLGRYPGKKEPEPADDYLGVELDWVWIETAQNFLLGSCRTYFLYLERPEHYPPGLPKGSTLCPACHGAVLTDAAAPRCKTCGGFGYVTGAGGRLPVAARLRMSWRMATQGMFFAAVLPLLAIVTALLGTLALLGPAPNRLLAGRQTPQALLQGYAQWYLLLMAGCALGLVWLAGCGFVSIRRTFRLRPVTVGVQARRGLCVFLTGIFFALYALFAGAMLLTEHVPGLWRQAQADLAQMESGGLETVTVWLSPKLHPDSLGGPYTAGQPQPVTRYGGISSETGGVWVRFYIPDVLAFQLDPDALYDETKDLNWNQAHARQYRLTYTTNLHLVMAVEPVETFASVEI